MFCRGSIGGLEGVVSWDFQPSATLCESYSLGEYSVDAWDPAKDPLRIRSLRALFLAAASWICDFTNRRPTRDEWAFLSVFFTKPPIMILQRMSTSSRNHSPCSGAPKPSSTGAIGSPGRDPPKVHFPLMSRPIGA